MKHLSICKESWKPFQLVNAWKQELMNRSLAYMHYILESTFALGSITNPCQHSLPKSRLDAWGELIGTFRFYDEDEYEFWLPVFSENTKEINNPYA